MHHPGRDAGGIPRIDPACFLQEHLPRDTQLAQLNEPESDCVQVHGSPLPNWPHLMKTVLILTLVGVFLSPLAIAQDALVTATVLDSDKRVPLFGANVTLMSRVDTASKRFSTTDREGIFSFSRVKEGAYTLRISFIGYEELSRNVTVTGGGVSLGILYLLQSSVVMKGMVVTGTVPPVDQVGDTLQFHSKAFQLNPDASAEDLVSKLPGVTIEDNTVKAQGEDVRQLLVDGRRFFSDDPMIALRNLPADVIERIQVYDKLSDQAELTGFDDGQAMRTMNIITRVDRRRGEFGRAVGGYGEQGRYQTVGNVNIFRGVQRITLLGQSNNINQQGFTLQDFLGAMGGGLGGGIRDGMRGGLMAGGMRGPGGMGGGMRGAGGGGGRMPLIAGPIQAEMAGNFLIGQQNGTNTTHALGGQFSDSWGTGLDVQGNYFFNLTDNRRDEVTNRQYFVTADTSQFYRENSLSNRSNYNHRLNMRIEYDLDSSNTLMLVPRLNLQSNSSASNFIGMNYLMENLLLSQSATRNESDVGGYTFSNGLIYRHKFEIPGRTLSIQLNANLNDRDSKGSLESGNTYFSGRLVQGDSLDQRANSRTKGYTLSLNLAYTEPVGVNSLVQLSYNVSFANNSTDKKTYNFDPQSREYDLLDATLSNELESDYLTQRASLGYQYQGSEWNFLAGVGYQSAALSARRVFPTQGTTDKAFTNVLPMATLRWRSSRTNNLQILYRTVTNPPAISQLENAIDNSNPLLLSTGNPDLKQYYTHSLTTRYSYTNVQNMNSVFVLLSGAITLDYIANALLLAQSDTLLEGGVLLKQGSQLSKPVNLGRQRTLRSMVNYSFPASFIMSNLNLNL
ncbi:MAG: TonB-dependent receptor, partial [Ignavibacteria bacterium]|nr:TonB-dependent receptor [Ignavibacteria bacterium]